MQSNGIVRLIVGTSSASQEELQSVIQLVNDAFEEDAFFKVQAKRQRIKHDLRFSGGDGVEDIEDVLGKSEFLVLEEQSEVLGCIRIDAPKGNAIGSFGMLSVPKRNQNRGIGKKLVFEAECALRDRHQCKRLEISVVNIRTPVVEFYEKLGYSQFGELVDFDELLGGEFLLKEYKGIVKFMWMGKDL